MAEKSDVYPSFSNQTKNPVKGGIVHFSSCKRDLHQFFAEFNPANCGFIICSRQRNFLSCHHVIPGLPSQKHIETEKFLQLIALWVQKPLKVPCAVKKKLPYGGFPEKQSNRAIRSAVRKYPRMLFPPPKKTLRNCEKSNA